MVTFTLGTQTISLRDPDFGDSDKIEIARIKRKSRGGDDIIYRDPQWPISETKDMRFSYLNQKQVSALLVFIDNTLGQVITMIDFEGRTWIGIITSPTADTSQPNRDGWSAQVVFQGVLSA